MKVFRNTMFQAMQAFVDFRPSHAPTCIKKLSILTASLQQYSISGFIYVYWQVIYCSLYHVICDVQPPKNPICSTDTKFGNFNRMSSEPRPINLLYKQKSRDIFHQCYEYIDYSVDCRRTTEPLIVKFRNINPIHLHDF
jgi:hypothetical protein